MPRYTLKKPSNPQIMPIGEFVKKIRKSKNFTLYRLAKETKIPYSTLKSMEDSGKTANFDYIVAISKVLNEPLDSFIKERRNSVNDGDEKRAV